MEPPKPEYTLVKDVTGKPPEKHGPQTLKDNRGNEIRVPFAPKSKCKRCWGRGYVGWDALEGGLILCKKCYPMMEAR